MDRIYIETLFRALPNEEFKKVYSAYLYQLKQEKFEHSKLNDDLIVIMNAAEQDERPFDQN